MKSSQSGQTGRQPEITLTVDGFEYGGWDGAIATVGMDRASGQFALTATDFLPGTGALRDRIFRPGDACALKVGAETVITGAIDSVDIGIENRAHTVSIRGRDKSADLVDCSAIKSPGQWKSSKVLDIVKQLAQPFGVAVSLNGDQGKALTSFALQEGETAFEAIDRAARLRGLLAMSDGAGGILLDRAGLNRAPGGLALGRNILAANATFDVRDRYSVYIAKGQAPGGDYFNGKAAAHIMASAKDPEITRYRPLLLTGEAPDAAGSLQDRVKWEATVRAGRSVVVDATVQGWLMEDMKLWRPNLLVHFQAEPLRLDRDLLITGCEYSIGTQGTTTRLVMTRPDAYTLEPIKPDPRPPQTAKAYFDLPKTLWDKPPQRR